MIVAGVINLIGGMSNLIGSMFTFIVSTVYADNQNLAYGCVYVVGASMNFLAMLLTLWESNELFEYDHIEDIETVGDMYDKEKEFDAGSSHLVLLVKNKKGYENLIYLVSKAYTDGFYSKPRIDTELLLGHCAKPYCLFPLHALPHHCHLLLPRHDA